MLYSNIIRIDIELHLCRLQSWSVISVIQQDESIDNYTKYEE